MKLVTATLAALALAAAPAFAAPLPAAPAASTMSYDSSLLRVGIDVGLLGKRSDNAHAERDGMYHLGESEFENPQPSPPTGLLDGLVRRQAAAAPPAAAKPSPGLIGSLGLAGALAPLGLGGLLPGVESAVGGIPIVGAPVAGIVSGADNAVGVTALLSPKDDANATANATVSASASAGASANVKRQQQPSDGLVGTLGLDGALGALGLGGILGTVEQTVDGLPLVGPLVGGLLGTVDGTVGLTALLSPPPVVGKRQLDALPSPQTIPPSTLLALLSTLQPSFTPASPADEVRALLSPATLDSLSVAESGIAGPASATRAPAPTATADATAAA